MHQIAEMTDTELLRQLKNGENEFFTLAEAHKTLAAAQIQCSIEELRKRIHCLFRDGYLGNEPATDGVHMYFVIFCPDC
jgi:hypothetical protein